MSKHTPEPWAILDNRNVEGVIVGGQGKTMHTGNSSPSQIATATQQEWMAPGERLENARRIVACVNACRGLPTDELEQKGLVAAVGAQLLKADDRAEGQEREICRLASVAANAENQLADALNQHDELLAALELMVAIHDEPSGFSGKCGKALDDAIQAQEEKIDERLLMARTAIAKAKGSATEQDASMEHPYTGKHMGHPDGDFSYLCGSDHCRCAQ